MWFQNDEDKMDLMPEGTHRMKFDDVKLDETKDPITLTIRWKSESGHAVWQNFRMGEKYGKYLSWQLGVLGVWDVRKTATDEADLARKLLMELAKLEGSHATLQISHREYQGRTFVDGIVKSVEVKLDPNAPKVDDSESIPF
jgi:hypothetical protein